MYAHIGGGNAHCCFECLNVVSMQHAGKFSRTVGVNLQLAAEQRVDPTVVHPGIDFALGDNGIYVLLSGERNTLTPAANQALR